jgi:hypothetical protein
MYEKINLLNVRGKNVGDYARQILRIIFTHEELTTSILPPGGTHYSRKTLDKEKFKLFDGMYCLLCSLRILKQDSNSITINLRYFCITKGFNVN